MTLQLWARKISVVLSELFKITIIILIIISVLFIIISSGLIDRYSAQIVLSNSMEPAIKTGSVIVTQKNKEGKYIQGDIITYFSPIDKQKLVTHRVERVLKNEKRVLIYTKGDANTNGDPWAVDVSLVLGKVTVAVPYLGYWLNIMKNSIGFLVFVVMTYILLIRTEIKMFFACLKK